MVDADLHIHSNHSNDGEFGALEIVEKCMAQQVGTFSLTDHNSVKGTHEVIAEARKAGLNFIPGIEIDCNYKGTDLHLLGYHIDWESNDFLQLENDIFSEVMGAFGDMIGNLHRLGFIIDEDAVLSKADGKLPSAELIAEVMLADEKYFSPLLTPYLKGGDRSDMPYINFYLDYFAQGKPAFVPVRYMSFADAVEMVRENGGIPVVAHPGLNLKGQENIAAELLKCGAEGLEVFNNYHTAEQIGYFASLVWQKKQIMTCGSDFHGKTKPLIKIGEFKRESSSDEYLGKSIRQLLHRLN